MGSGSLNAMAVFEASYKEDMSQEEAEALVARAIRSGSCVLTLIKRVQMPFGLYTNTPKFAWYETWNYGRTHHRNQARSLVQESFSLDIRVTNLVQGQMKCTSIV